MKDKGSAACENLPGLVFFNSRLIRNYLQPLFFFIATAKALACMLADFSN